MVVNSVVVAVEQVLVVVVFLVFVGVVALVVDFREVMMTPSLKLAHCAPPPALSPKTAYKASISSFSYIPQNNNV